MPAATGPEPSVEGAVEALPWSDFLAQFRWEQGDHLTLVGPTRSGKTTLAQEILPRRRWVTTFKTKRRDPVMERFRAQGYRELPEWVVSDADLAPRVILAPRGGKNIEAQIERQRKVFREAISRIWRQGGWCLYLDELRYITEYLGLKREVEMLWQQGRSEGITVVGGIQRPRHVPLLAYDQATHLFLWYNGDLSTLDRLGEIGGGIDADRVKAAVGALGFHEVLYVNTVPPGRLIRTKVA